MYFSSYIFQTQLKNNSRDKKKIWGIQVNEVWVIETQTYIITDCHHTL